MDFKPVAASWLIAVVALSLIYVQVCQDRLQYPRFKALEDTASRQAVYRGWLRSAWLHYTLLGAAGLLLLRRPDVLWRAPADFLDALQPDLARAGVAPDALASLGSGIVGGLLAGTVMALVLPLLFGRRALPPLLGDVEALLPRNAAEMRLCAALALNAGVGEEIFFRALLPIAVWQITGDAAAGVLAGSLLFAGAHLYQGLAGIAGTFALGVLFAGVYVCTRQLWLAMLLHALIDVRELLGTAWVRRQHR